MGHWSKESSYSRGGNRRKVMRDDGWVLFKPGWEVKLFTDPFEEVLCVRREWRKKIIATCRFPKGSVAMFGDELLRSVLMGLVRKNAVESNGKPGAVARPVRMAREWPIVTSYLFDETYENGEPRQRSTVTIMAGDVAGIKVVLNDRAEAMSLWATGDDIDECLSTMETMLHRNDAPWRRDKAYAQPKKK